MTYTQDYSTTTIIDDFGSESNYPTAFGITFTPKVSGIGLGLLGLFGAGYVLVTFFMPALGKYLELKLDETTKQEQVNQQTQSTLQQKLQEAEGRLQQAEKRRATVLDLYANSNDLKTLLLDVNTLIQSRDLTFLNFLPQGDPVIIGDDSLGAGAKNKLKRQTYQLTIKGPFGNTHNFLRDLERLQPLILIKDLKTDLVQTEIPVNLVQSGNRAELKPQINDTLNTSMTLDVLLPLTPEEIAALAPPPPPPGGAGQAQKPEETPKK
ncbi:pilus assembly protein [Synechocystis sp. LKSZ1]|uniref:pilus assembly protein n=1 Tax=Synechocystis sp. LKSZ1 TaxID=3144951 RepID=UPI00336BBF58